MDSPLRSLPLGMPARPRLQTPPVRPAGTTPQPLNLTSFFTGGIGNTPTIGPGMPTPQRMFPYALVTPRY